MSLRLSLFAALASFGLGAASGAAPGAAQGAAQTVEATARAASEQLLAAGDMLEEAERASDRISALTDTVRAYEAGLTSLRAGLRQVYLQERTLRAKLEDQRGDIAQLMGVLARMGRAPAPLLLLHPSGPVGTARAGQMIADITPALQARANTLRQDLETLVLLQTLQTQAETSLTAGLDGVREARLALANAVRDRTSLPRRFSADGAGLAALVQSADTLAGFADGLRDMTETASAPFLGARVGALPLPVSGVLLRGFGAADAAGITRPGWLLATEAGALVTSPLDATIRYAGPLLDYGQVVILEPRQGALMILGGMSETYGSPGEILSAGAPLGVMGGPAPSSADFLAEVGQGGGGARRETLYIEIREGDAPVDPQTWFAL